MIVNCIHPCSIVYIYYTGIYARSTTRIETHFYLRNTRFHITHCHSFLPVLSKARDRSLEVPCTTRCLIRVATFFKGVALFALILKLQQLLVAAVCPIAKCYIMQLCAYLYNHTYDRRTTSNIIVRIHIIK